MKNIINKITHRLIPLTGGWIFAFAFMFAGHGFAQGGDTAASASFSSAGFNLRPPIVARPTPDHALEAAYVVHNVLPGGTHFLYLTEKVTPNRTPQPPVPPVLVDTGKKFGDHALMITTDKKVGIIYSKETGASNTATVHFKLYQGAITSTSTPVLNDQLPAPNPHGNLVVKGVTAMHIGNEYHAVVTGTDRPLLQRPRRFAYYFKRPAATTGTWALVNPPLYMITNSNDTVGRGVGLYPRPGQSVAVVIVPEVVNTPCIGRISGCGRITKIFYNHSTNTIVNTSVLASTPPTNFWVGDFPTTLSYERFFPVSGLIDPNGSTFLNLNPVAFNNNNPFPGIGIYGNPATQTNFLTLGFIALPNTYAWGNDMEYVTGGYNLLTVEGNGGGYSTGGRELKYNFSTTGQFNFSAATTIVNLPAGDVFYSPSTTKDVNRQFYHGAILRKGSTRTTEGWAYYFTTSWQSTGLFTTSSTQEADRLKMAIRPL